MKHKHNYMSFVLIFEFEYVMHLCLAIATEQTGLSSTPTRQNTFTPDYTTVPSISSTDLQTPVTSPVNTTEHIFNTTEILSDFISFEGQDNNTSLKEYTDGTDQGCIENIKASSGNISSPDFPDNYGPNLQCDWIIIVPVNFKVRLKFITFNLPPKTNERCLNGYVEIGQYNENGLRVVNEGHYCGNIVPGEYVTPDNRCWIYFFGGMQPHGNENYSFSIKFDSIQTEDNASSNSRIGLLALLVILVPIICSIVTYCCLKKKRITKMELEYYGKFRSKHYPSMEPSRHGEHIQIRVSKPSEEDYNNNISLINSSLQYDMLPNKQSNFHVYRVMRPKTSAARTSDGSVFLHNTFDQDDILSPQRTSASTSSGQFLTLPEINKRTSYISLRPVLNSNCSSARGTSMYSVSDTQTDREMSSEGSHSNQQFTPGSISQDTPMIYVQDPDKNKSNFPMTSHHGDNFCVTSVGMQLARYQTQALVNSDTQEELTPLGNVRKLKDRSKSLSLPTKCFMAPQFEGKSRLLSERHRSLHLTESEWREARGALYNNSVRGDQHSAIPNHNIVEKSHRGKGLRKPSISRPPRLEVLPEVDPSESFSSVENKILQEIFVSIPQNGVNYPSENKQEQGEENTERSFEQKSNNLLQKTNTVSSNDCTNSENKYSSSYISQMREDDKISHCHQNYRLYGTQSEGALCRYDNQQAVRRMSFQEKSVHQNSDPSVLTRNQTKDTQRKSRKKSPQRDHSVIQADERNESLNMLRHYDVPDSASDETQPPAGYRDKDIQYFLSEETHCLSHIHRERLFSSEGYNDYGNATYIVPKVKNIARGVNRRNSYRTEQTKCTSFLPSTTNTYLPDETRTNQFIPDQAQKDSFIPDDTRYSSVVTDKSRSNSHVPDESVKLGSRRNNSYTHGTCRDSHIYDTTQNNSYIPGYSIHANSCRTDIAIPNMYLPGVTRSNSFQPDMSTRNSLYITDMSRNISLSHLPDMTRNNSYMFEMAQNASYIQEMNVNASFMPDANHAYGKQFNTSSDEYKYSEANKSVTVDINNNTDDNPSVTILSDFYPNQSGVIVLEEGESMV